MSRNEPVKTTSTEVLTGWTKGSFTAAGFTRGTYRRGVGPVVIVIHEIPGITPNVAAFADEVVQAGFTVVMPSLVGDPGREISAARALCPQAYSHAPGKLRLSSTCKNPTIRTVTSKAYGIKKSEPLPIALNAGGRL